LVTRAVPDDTLELLRVGLPGVEIDVNRKSRPLTPRELIERGRGCPAILCTLADRMDCEVFAALAPDLKVAAQFAVGFNNIDLDAAAAHKVVVTNTPGVLTEATAEVAVGLILACARRVVEGDAITRAGRFEGWAPMFHLGASVHGKTVGIVGAGRIGRRVAEIMHDGFRCEIVYTSRSEHADWERVLSARRLPLRRLLEISDFVSVHCPLTPQTRHLIDATALSRMQPTACLINTARGPVVDEAALLDALYSGRIGGAGLDVYEREPDLTPGLAQAPNTVLLPHVGSATREARDAMGRLCAGAIIDVMRGRTPPNVVTDR